MIQVFTGFTFASSWIFTWIRILVFSAFRLRRYIYKEIWNLEISFQHDFREDVSQISIMRLSLQLFRVFYNDDSRDSHDDDLLNFLDLWICDISMTTISTTRIFQINATTIPYIPAILRPAISEMPPIFYVKPSQQRLFMLSHPKHPFHDQSFRTSCWTIRDEAYHTLSHPDEYSTPKHHKRSPSHAETSRTDAYFAPNHLKRIQSHVEPTWCRNFWGIRFVSMVSDFLHRYSDSYQNSEFYKKQDCHHDFHHDFHKDSPFHDSVAELRIHATIQLTPRSRFPPWFRHRVSRFSTKTSFFLLFY